MDDDLVPLYSNRPEWADITPLEQFENQNPISPIAYTEEYKDATGYFRAIVKAGEKTKRVLGLTETVIRLNPAHYPAWQYRYETLVALLFPNGDPKPSKSLASHPLIVYEMSLMDQVAVQFLKTYQVWHHRRLLVSLVLNPRRELQFIQESLRADTKNYHTWSYRQWILAFFGGTTIATEEDDDDEAESEEDLWAGELGFVDSMLVQDVRNNSAWHHRFFVVWDSGVREDREAVLKREFAYVKGKIALAPNNPSAWNYLRGMLTKTGTPLSSVENFVKPFTVNSREEVPKSDVVDLEDPLPEEGAQLPCTGALEFLADVYEAQGQAGIDSAVEIWRRLGNELDTIRKKYWEYRIRTAHQNLKTQPQAA